MQVDLDVIVPSAHPVESVLVVLDALAVAVDAAGLARERVVVCDDHPRCDPGFRPQVHERGFRYLRTGGVGAARARNLGAASGDSPLIVFVDDDVVLDRDALAELRAAFGVVPTPTVVVGGLRPPSSADAWLRWSYEDATLTPATAYGHDGAVPAEALGAALLGVRREVFDSVGGFPPVHGIEDVLLGLALRSALGSRHRTIRHTAASGVHQYEPSWPQWLARNEAAGRRLGEVLCTLEPDVARSLVRANGLGKSPRARAKMALGYAPTWLLRSARTRIGRKAAASGALAKGFRRSRS